MKKVIFSILFLLLGVCLFFCYKGRQEELRVRVVSNSDCLEDILYKEEVVSYLKEEILSNIEITDSYLKKHYHDIGEKLSEHFSNIEVSYEYHTFENKAYNDTALSNGTYKTLLIMIGSHLGPNWWGSIYDGSLKRESTDVITYEWYSRKYFE